MWDRHAEAGHMTLADESEMTVGVLPHVWPASAWPWGSALPRCVKSLPLSIAVHPLGSVGQRTSLSSSSINAIMGVVVGGNFVSVVADCLCIERTYAQDRNSVLAIEV